MRFPYPVFPIRVQVAQWISLSLQVRVFHLKINKTTLLSYSRLYCFRVSHVNQNNALCVTKRRYRHQVARNHLTPVPPADYVILSAWKITPL